MRQRGKQFFNALRAKISKEDMDFIATHLNTKEAILFWGMNLPDQQHALKVVYTAITIAIGRQDIDKETLYKAALLHDVGRVKGDLSTIDKVIAVLANKFAPAQARKWGRFGRGGKLANLKHALFVFYNHPLLGAALLKEVGVSDKVIDLVAQHHLAETTEDTPELNILRQADKLN
jgi:putative nucleotidyltransferase with HDIG domain